MLDDPFPDLPGQVQPHETWVAVLELCDDPQGLLVVVEPAPPSHQPAQGCLTSVSKGRVPQIVSQADRLNQIFVGSEGAGNRAPDLGDLKRVCQPCPIVIA